MEAKIIIPSKGRAKIVTTTKFIARAALCVAESEVEEYAEYNPGVEIVAHPDSVIGLPPKRQWIYDKFKNVFMFDDDCYGLKRVCQKQHESDTIGPEEAYDIVQFIMNMAKMMDCYMCTFKYTSNPLHYNAHEPYELTGCMCEPCFGLLEGAIKLKCDPGIVASYEWYMSGLNAYYYRKIFIETRFTNVLPAKQNKVGGICDQRTMDTEKNDLRILIDSFGEAVVATRNKGQEAANIMFQKKLKIPF